MTFGPKRCIDIDDDTDDHSSCFFQYFHFASSAPNYVHIQKCLYNTAAKASNGYDLKLCSRTGKYKTSYIFWPKTVFGTSQEDERTNQQIHGNPAPKFAHPSIF